MNLDALDAWTPPQPFVIDPLAAAAFAAATNDPDPRRLAGDAVAPMYTVAPAREPAIAAVAALVPQAVLDTVPGLHGEQDMRFHAPIRPGMTLLVTAAARGVRVKSSGTLVAIEVRLSEAGGRSISEHWITTLFPGLTTGPSAGVMPPEHALPAEIRTRQADENSRCATDPDQTFRYAAAARDPTRFHIDEAEARRLGLPGLILHGLCTMAICAHTLARDRDLTRLAVRFARPVRPGSSLEIAAWRFDGTGRRAFEVLADGATVIRNGLIEVGEP